MLTTTEQIKDWLESVSDPEIPVLTINDMGIVRTINVEEDLVTISITPTYSGCPAMQTIEKEIKACLKFHGIPHTEVKEVLSPAWTTDWLTEAGREKLREYGIAPPEENSVDKSLLKGEPKQVQCPHCGSQQTEMVSQFGSTPCKALYKCHDCLEPFDYFKCI